MSRSQARIPGVAGVEAVLLGAAGSLAVVGLIVWSGARLAALPSGGTVSGNLADWLAAATHLLRHPGDPAEAWGSSAEGLPGPALYWAGNLVALVLIGLVAAGVAWWARRLYGSGPRRFGAPTDARVARRLDVGPLVVHSTVPPIGRFLLGRMARRGPLLATEDHQRHPLRWPNRTRQGDRGSVALIGPTRSGKTVAAAAGIIGWRGPVVAQSVKRDLYDVTAGARAASGEIAVFDPSAVTQLRSARWTPLRDVTTASSALRAGRALAQAIPRMGVQGVDFWAQHGEALCSAYMALAGLSQLLPSPAGAVPTEPALTIQMLATWAFHQAGITHPEINSLLRRGLAEGNPLEVRLLAEQAMTQLMALHREDSRIRGSIFATGRLAFRAWLEPAVAHSASHDPRWAYDSKPDESWERRPRWLDLDWLMGRKDDGQANTLYLCAPETEFARLAPVLGGLLGDLREQIHSWDVRGRRLEKPLLIVVDEAGQLGLQWMPAAVSTLAGLGAILVTGWQSRAQIVDAYGTLADAVMSGHRSKVFFAGLDDPASTDWLAKVAGHEPIGRRGWSADVRSGSRTVSEHLQREELLPANAVRQMRPRDAVLVHGTLPPVHLRVVPWWRDPALRALVPTDEDGRPKPPPDVDTCPLGDSSPPATEVPQDPTTIEEALARLPAPVRRPSPVPAPRHPAAPAAAVHEPAESSGQESRRRSPKVSQAAGSPSSLPGQLPLDFSQPGVAVTDRPSADVEPLPDPRPLARNRVAGGCDRCRTWIKVGEGEVITFGARELLRCFPSCSS